MIEYLLSLEVKDDKLPKIVSQYIINDDEWNKLNSIFESDYYLLIKDKEFSYYDLEVSSYTLKYSLNDDKEIIKIFKKLYKNYFGTYDILGFIRNNENNIVKKEKENNEIFDMDELDVDYYIESKNNTPEFSSITDEKIKNIIRETNKVVNKYKSN